VIRAIIIVMGFSLLAGGFIEKALSNSNATVMQAADTGVWHVVD
jgi:hypothetical protein